jgi:hypothetical protein
MSTRFTAQHMSDKQMLAWRRDALKEIREKEAVASRHAPGTPWRTRAERTIAEIKRRLEIDRRKL